LGHSNSAIGVLGDVDPAVLPCGASSATLPQASPSKPDVVARVPD
jgi:hypothetical protein